MTTLHFTRRFVFFLGMALLFIAPSVGYSQQPSGTPTIRILVFDEFDIPDNILYPADDFYAGELCAVTPEALMGQGRLGVITGMGFVEDVSHGEAVTDIILGTLAERRGSQIASHSLGYDVIYGNQIIRVETVDIFDNTSITLSQIIELIWSKVDGTDIPTVLNMSFAFVPCELLNARFVSFDEVEYFMSNSDGSDDPFYDLISNQWNLILVASAGNFGLPYPLYPAAYMGIVSVGANDTDRFNEAEVAHYSSWSRVISRNNTVVGSGTSFSAPRVTASLGLYLFDGNDTRCRDESIPLNFEDYVAPWEGSWDLEDVLYTGYSDYCR